VDLVSDFILEQSLDMLVITETWLLPSVASSFVRLHGFSIVRGDTGGESRKHGVCIYIKESVRYEEVALHKPNVAAVFLSQHDVWVLAVYRPPSYGERENAELMGLILDFSVGREVVVLGDFNLPSIEWSDGEAGGAISSADRLFLDCFTVCGLQQWVDEPTFLSSGNILDLFFTSELDRVGNVDVLAPFPRCSHSPVICDYLFDSDGDPDLEDLPSLRYCWQRGNYAAIGEGLSEVDWPLEFTHLPVNEIYSVFCGILNNLVSLHVPSSTCVPAPPWTPRPPRQLKVERRRAWSVYKDMRARFGRRDVQVLEALKNFHVLNHQVRSYVLASRAEYEEGLMNQYRNSPKLFHSYIRRMKKGCLGVGPLRNRAGQLVDDPHEMAELLASSFSGVYRGDIPMNPAPFQSFEGEMSNFAVTPQEVFDVLSALNASSAMGLDGLHPKLLKECAEQLSRPLCLLFNLSLQSGLIPDAWRESLVVPIFKGKSRYDPLNYRPVSLTSVCCKSMERVVSARLVEFLESHELLSHRQFGFRKARSTEDQLLLAYSEVVESVDAGLVVDVALLDFSKAFDVVSHHVLLGKLLALGISGDLLRWIAAFLDSRTMCVGVNKVNSDPRDVLSGVPQGSVLGPVLFLVYVNFLTNGISSEFVAFADDYKIYLSFQRLEAAAGVSLLQADLDRISQAANSWNLSLNPGKCVVLRFRRRFVDWNINDAGPGYTLGGSRLEFVQVHRDLGVDVDVGLKFHGHVRGVVCRAAGLCNDLLRSTVNRSPDFMVTLFVTHVRPVLDYCSCVWNLGYVQDITLLESVQRRWTKQVRGLAELSYYNRLRVLNLFSIKGRLLRADLIKYFKILCCDSDGFDLSGLFQRSPGGRTRGHAHKLVMPRCSLEVSRRFFNVRCVRIWNELPSDVVESSCVSTFKAGLMEFLGEELYQF
jgi:hypothetical protein